MAPTAVIKKTQLRIVVLLWSVKTAAHETPFGQSILKSYAAQGSAKAAVQVAEDLIPQALETS